MADTQVTQEVSVEFNNFYNVDLFQRGYYQVRCQISLPNKLTKFIECELKEEKGGSKQSPCLFKAFTDKHAPIGITRTFEVYYKHENVQINDNFIFKLHMLVDGSKIENMLPAKLELVVDLYFTECSRSPATPKSLEKVSSQTLDINTTFGKSFHSSRPILFDYFHLGALNLTVHSCVTSVRQPWLASLKQQHPIWSGKSGNIKTFCYNSLFGRSSSLSSNQNVDTRQKSNASFLHRKLCLQLLRLYEQLLDFYHRTITFLPDYAQMRLSKVDIQAKLDVLNNEFDRLSTAEELYLRMGDDLYLLSTELSLLWMQFLEQFTFEDFLKQNLLSQHHQARVEHMREAFFTEDHAWLSLCTSHELSASQQTRMGNLIKGSLYYQLIPPVDLACAVLDGDISTMPIIFEDRYIPGKTDEDVEDEDKLLTVEESIVGDDFVDMDVSIEELSGRSNSLSIVDDKSSSSDEENEVIEVPNFTVDKFNERRSVQLKKKYSDSMSKDWDMSKEKLRKSLYLSQETDLTGPDYCEEPVNEEGKKDPSIVTNTIGSTKKEENKLTNFVKVHSDTQLVGKPNQVEKLKKKSISSSCDSSPTQKQKNRCLSQKELSKSMTNVAANKDTAVFYARLEEPPGPDKKLAQMSNELKLEDVEDKVEGEKIIAEAIINTPPSPSDQYKPKLWSCFPAIKSGSKRNSYKMVMQSPPYMPVSRENTSRFQRAKENLLNSFNFHGHKYSHLSIVSMVKPYFTERIVSTTENVHLIVCVHGLDGNSGDLRLVKCYLEMALPRANLDFLMSEVNQDDTFGDIDEMTNRLVREILNYIEEQRIEVDKISFVGHSLGTIIIRNAVVHSSLFQYRNRLHTFLSLSGPHLGMQFHTSNLVSTGMWLIQKWKKAGSLVQLALNDCSDPRETFMYRLSLTNGFQYFKNVLLVSSVQDHYVPFHSARVEMSKQAVKDNSEGGRVYKEMLDNIMGPLMIQEEINIIKYSVYHPMASSANTFIGRAAHIAMLDSELFLEKFILVTASKYFA